MQFIKKATSSPRGFRATMTSGAVTTSHEAASFFMKMEDKGAEPSDLDGYITIGRMVDGGRDWKEISRIADSFNVAGR